MATHTAGTTNVGLSIATAAASRPNSNSADTSGDRRIVRLPPLVGLHDLGSVLQGHSNE